MCGFFQLQHRFFVDKEPEMGQQHTQSIVQASMTLRTNVHQQPCQFVILKHPSVVNHNFYFRGLNSEIYLDRKMKQTLVMLGWQTKQFLINNKTMAYRGYMYKNSVQGNFSVNFLEHKVFFKFIIKVLLITQKYHGRFARHNMTFALQGSWS